MKKSLIIMHDLGKETKKMADEMEKLKSYFDEAMIDEMKRRISEGDIPLSELDRMVEYIHRDFEDLQQMDRYWSDCTELERKIIVKLQEKVNDTEWGLPDFWVDLFRNSTLCIGLTKQKRNVHRYRRCLQMSLPEFANRLPN